MLESMTGAHDDEWDDEWRDEDDLELPPAWFAGQHLPEQAQRMGLTHHVPDGALLDFAGSLDSSKKLHRFTAWMMLIVFGMPVLFYIARLVQAVIPG